MSRFYNTKIDLGGIVRVMTDPEKKTYEGSCHCGAVTFKATMEPPKVAYACNCSICSRAGYLLAFAKDFEPSPNEAEATTDYQFAKKKIHHLFCKTCGVRAYSRGADKDGAPTMAVNLRCIPGLDVGSLTVQSFDGASL